MKDSLRFLAILAVLIVAVPLLAQKKKKPAPETKASPVADASARTAKPVHYDDSAEFEKSFKELYPLVRPKGSTRDAAKQQVDRQLALFVKQGIDSNEVIKAAYTGLDEDAAYKIYYETYRQKLSAKDLRGYIAFLKTPEGAKIQSVMLELSRAQAEVNNYITKTINTNLTPLRTIMRENMTKLQKEREEQLKSDTTETGRMYRQQMHVRDSIMQARGIKPVQQEPVNPTPAPDKN
jgi:hypothetical protein